MNAMGIPDDVIQTVTGHKNPKSLKRYDRTTIIRHLSTQQASRMHGVVSYKDLLCVNMEMWKRKNSLESAPLSSRSIDQLGGSIVIELSKLSECSESPIWDSPPCNLSNFADVETCFLSPCRNPSCSPPASQLVPPCTSNPIGHLSNCFFEPCEHLLLCPATSMNERYDAIDRHFPVIKSPAIDRHFLVVESLVRSEREIIDLDSPPPSGTLVSSGSLGSPVQAFGTRNRLSRAERNLLKAQRLRAQNKHSFTSELEIGRAKHRNQEPRNFGRIRSNYSKLAKKRREEAALMYEQLKRNSVCIAAGWNSDTLLASLTDLDCVQNVATAPAMHPAQLSAPPSSSLPVNARLVETPSSVLTTCGEAVFSVNLSSASNVSSTTLPTPATSEQHGSAHSWV
jgi:hypothetical protein